MIDLHIHLHPLQAAEALHFAKAAGYRAAGLLTHSLEELAALRRTVHELGLYIDMGALLGVELAYIPPALLPQAVEKARAAGADYVVVHGENLGSAVPEGTNFAAIAARADILAHPGLIDPECAAYAAENQVALALSTNPHYALANAHIAALAKAHASPLICGGTVHEREHCISPAQRKLVLKGANIDETLQRQMQNSAHALYLAFAAQKK